MANAAMAIQVLPRTIDQQAVIEIVDAAILAIKDSGLSYEVGAFETTIEGDLDQLVQLIPKIQKAGIAAGADMLSNYIKLTYAPEKHILTTEEKLAKYR